MDMNIHACQPFDLIEVTICERKSVCLKKAFKDYRDFGKAGAFDAIQGGCLLIVETKRYIEKLDGGVGTIKLWVCHQDLNVTFVINDSDMASEIKRCTDANQLLSLIAGETFAECLNQVTLTAAEIDAALMFLRAAKATTRSYEGAR